MDDAVRSLGRYVAERREAMGMSQTELGEALGGRTQKWVSNFERGVVVNLPDPFTMKAIATTLQTSVEALLEAAGYIEGEGRWSQPGDLLYRQHELKRELRALQQRIGVAIAMIDGYEVEARGAPE